MTDPTPKPAGVELVESNPDLQDDLTATPDDDVAIELPLEPGDPDAQPQ